MYDPAETLEIEIKGVGKFKGRLMTERQLKEFNRATDITGKMTLEEHHKRLNDALSLGLIDADLEGYTIGQKQQMIDQLPWAITHAEFESLKKASGSPSDLPTE